MVENVVYQIFPLQMLIWDERENLLMRQFTEGREHIEKREWRALSRALGTKNPKQCYDHFMLQKTRLFGDTSSEADAHHKWTAQELELLASFDQRQVTWSQFQQKYLPHLSLSQIKNQRQRQTYLQGLTTAKPHRSHEQQKESLSNNSDLQPDFLKQLEMLLRK